ncbi:telomere repeats-binding bouquet formation protein 2 isoform X2 [Sceloporus undulatus]|nr:telomere repeats-binding bouquet formation protein 2 isoform X2 [Sceloporus undulatus]XP_042331604.1 telomere repeats-binding bouquet formation protein 2 isoform X2 [Sceloporus undulatus]XP_042331605.1 telomere repeats-binding bouquet formation protein 2 isoform X2 [Sceloporus undulatus]XP_042331606.1 telomere repeats-binding bouquet formation protein 2 isoform X2 [Sceloporus undulatus]
MFSSDASHPDTKRIHQSLDYLEGKITVFHSCYLTACANSEIKNTVPLGHFLLPPACLHQEIRQKIGSFIWEQITDLQKQQGSQYAEVEDNKAEDEQSRRTLERSEDIHTPETLETGKLTYIPLQDYPTSNMVTGYASAKEMKKFLGEIRDFIPGCSGYLAYWIPNETKALSVVKTKLKRKL